MAMDHVVIIIALYVNALMDGLVQIAQAVLLGLEVTPYHVVSYNIVIIILKY